MNITDFYAFMGGVAFAIIVFVAFVYSINPHDCANRPEPVSSEDQKETKP